MPQLTNNTDTITFQKQNNIITLATNKTYVDSNITLTTKVTKAVLDGTTDKTQFRVQIPNGTINNVPSTLTLLFTTDANGNTVVTGTNA